MLENQLLLRLAEQYGTPLYVYDLDLVTARYRDLFEFIPDPGLEIRYAMKANYNVALLRHFNAIGCGLDTVSPAEVLLALKLGFPPGRIIYTANNLTDAEVALVRETGVLMNLGSLSRLEKFARAYPGSRICLRFNPDVCDGDNERTMTAGALTKFGLLFDDLAAVLAIVRRHRLRVVGLHEHTGSGLQRVESVFQSMCNLMAIATPGNFPDLEFLDFGGGFKVPYRPDEARVDYRSMGAEIARLFADFCRGYGRPLKILFEPGKYLVAECGVLLTRVNTLKHNRQREIAGCDSGFPQLIRPVLYGAYHQVDNLSNPEGPRRCYDVCGNICETGDRFAEQRELPEIREGDLLAIRNAGAYCYAMGGVYNLRPMPTEVVVQEGRARLARRGFSHRELAERILELSETEPGDGTGKA